MSGFSERILNNCPRGINNVPDITSPVTIQISGEVPSWVKGTILSTGPGTLDLENGSVKSWMDGYTIISKFEINGKTLKFSSKHIQSTSYKKAVKAGRPVVPEFSTPPGHDSSKGFFSRLLPAFTPNDITDNNFGSRIAKLGPHYYVCLETGTIHEIDPKTLNTITSLNVFKTFGITSFCPEVQQIDKNGDTFIMGPTINPTFQYGLLKMTKANQNNKLEKKFQVCGWIPSRWKFGAAGPRCLTTSTENYIILIEIPLVFNFIRLAATFIKGYCMHDWLDWKPADGVCFRIIHKETGKVIKTEYFAEKAFVICDIVNAYEDGDKLVFDICSYSSPGWDAFYLDNLRKLSASETYSPAVFHRYVIPIVSEIKNIPEGVNLLPQQSTSLGKAIRKGNRINLTPGSIISGDAPGFDLGSINPHKKTKLYTFVYIVSQLASIIKKSAIGYGIVKVDLRSKNNTSKMLKWEGEVGQLPCKPVFLPNPKGVDEDDGILITLVKYFGKSNVASHPDFLLLIDPKTMKEVARANFKNFNVSHWNHAAFLDV